MRRRHAHRPRPVRDRAAIAAAIGCLTLVALVGVRLVPASDAGGAGVALSRTSPVSAPAAAGTNDPSPSLAAGPSILDFRPPSSAPPSQPSSQPTALGSRFPGGLLIADRGNSRLIVVNDAGRILWRFPVHGSLPPGQSFSADDAFVAPDGRTIVANDEAHQVIDRIDIATRRVVWQYGVYDRPGGTRGHLHTPDDAYPLANGDVVTADIRNCRILEIDPAKRIVRQWGRTGVCRHDPPRTFDQPNGDTPLPDGGLLITEITGSRVVRLAANGHVVFDIHVPVAYPSDAQLDRDGSVIVVDFSNPGAILRVSPTGHVTWRYWVRGGARRLDHPSLAVPLADGTIALNDDGRDRVIVVDPATNRIVWQYGRTDRRSRSGGGLWIPDGIDVVPVGIFTSP